MMRRKFAFRFALLVVIVLSAFAIAELYSTKTAKPVTATDLPMRELYLEPKEEAGLDD